MRKRRLRRKSLLLSSRKPSSSKTAEREPVLRQKKSARERIQEITWARHEAERRAAEAERQLAEFRAAKRLNPLRQPQRSRRLTSSRTMTATSKPSPNGGPARLCATH
jgi:hypothetical protein